MSSSTLVADDYSLLAVKKSFSLAEIVLTDLSWSISFLLSASLTLTVGEVAPAASCSLEGEASAPSLPSWETFSSMIVAWTLESSFVFLVGLAPPFLPLPLTFFAEPLTVGDFLFYELCYFLGASGEGDLSSSFFSSLASYFYSAGSFFVSSSLSAAFAGV